MKGGMKRGDRVMHVQVGLLTTPAPGNFAGKGKQLS